MNVNSYQQIRKQNYTCNNNNAIKQISIIENY